MLEINAHKPKFQYIPFTAAIFAGVLVFWIIAEAIILHDNYNFPSKTYFFGGGISTIEMMIIVFVISILLLPICWVVVLPVAFAEVWISNRFNLRSSITYPLLGGVITGTPFVHFILNQPPSPPMAHYLVLSFTSALPGIVGGYIYHAVKCKVAASAASSAGQVN